MVTVLPAPCQDCSGHGIIVGAAGVRGYGDPETVECEEDCDSCRGTGVVLCDCRRPAVAYDRPTGEALCSICAVEAHLTDEPATCAVIGSLVRDAARFAADGWPLIRTALSASIARAIRTRAA